MRLPEFGAPAPRHHEEDAIRDAERQAKPASYSRSLSPFHPILSKLGHDLLCNGLVALYVDFGDARALVAKGRSGKVDTKFLLD